MIDVPAHFLSATDRAVFEAAGYGKRQGLGQRPLLLVIDMTYNFIGERSLPILEAAQERRASCGEYGWRALPAIQAAMAAFRARGWPLVYTIMDDQDLSPAGRGFASKNHRYADADEQTRTRAGNRVVDELAPLPGEPVLAKQKPSAFFGTPLLAYMIGQHIESVVVTGCTTSGCVRGTVVDAFSLNYPVTVLSDAVFDRFELSHYASLFDLDCKYADVISTEGLLSALPTE
jgi:nicotinamidase-related amidase